MRSCLLQIKHLRCQFCYELLSHVWIKLQGNKEKAMLKEDGMNNSFGFLSGALTSICHFFCSSICLSVHHAPFLGNRTSSNHNFWYICVGIFFIFLKFWFFGLLGGKKAKNGPNWQKFLSVMLHITGTIHQMIVIYGANVFNYNISRCLFQF